MDADEMKGAPALPRGNATWFITMENNTKCLKKNKKMAHSDPVISNGYYNSKRNKKQYFLNAYALPFFTAALYKPR